MHIVHVAAIELSPNSGMGRIAFEWKKAFEQQGIKFTHIGWKELSRSAHPLLFGWHVRKFIIQNKLKPNLILAHEPTGGFLKFKNVPLVVFSHGVEERNWQIKKKYDFEPLSWKAKLLPVLFRFYSNTIGFKKANKILLSNQTDKNFLTNYKRIQASKIHIFKNGFHKYPGKTKYNFSHIGCLFNASWIERKGIQLLIPVFNSLLKKYPELFLYIAGTNKNASDLLANFDAAIYAQIIIFPKFSASDEHLIYKQTSIFILPSYFEGQSLALSQAMYMGLCPVVADNCGQIDLVHHGQNGLLFQTGDQCDFQSQVEALINNPKLIAQYGESAFNTVQSSTWEAVSNEVVQFVL
ncbi:MAG: hypothetical protein RL596_2606 [Bacteroidota bacterium]